MTLTHSRLKTVFSFVAVLAASSVTAAPISAAADEVDSRVALQLVADGFTSPVDLDELPDGSGRLLITDQAGMIHLVAPGKERNSLFLDLRERMVSLREGFDERGLLGLALHPDFGNNRRFFVYYSAPLRPDGPDGFDHTARLSEFTANTDFSGADPASERVVLEVDQPQGNHNGGSIVFGPDGYLYLSLGDGGAGKDVGLGHPAIGNGQDTSSLLGSVLRLDVDGKQPYAIPTDNPFVGKEGRDEIFAYGLRNTWGLSFDENGNLFGADVGQHLFEEVNILVRGHNYGWNRREGFHCFDPESPREPPEDCPKTGYHGEPLRDPIIEYRNSSAFPEAEDAYGICIVGGHRYSGEELPHLDGHYIFGDWSRQWGRGAGRLLIASPPGGDFSGRWQVKPFRIATHEKGELDSFLLALGRDGDGELYVMTTDKQGPADQTGELYRLIAQGEE